MGKTLVIEMSRCIWVIDERELKKHLPTDVQMNAIKRGKGFSRMEKSYHTKGSGKHATYPQD